MATTYNQELYAGLWIQRRDKTTNEEEINRLKATDPFGEETIRGISIGGLWIA